MAKAPLLLLLSLVVGLASAWYLPGTTQQEYYAKKDMRMQLDSLSSAKTASPLLYTYEKVPLCDVPRNDKGKPIMQAETLGEVLMGERIMQSNYTTKFLDEDTGCQVLCYREWQAVEDGHEHAWLADLIEDEYRLNLILDHMPAFRPGKRQGSNEVVYSMGVPIGAYGDENWPKSKPGVPYIYNHLAMKVFYNMDPVIKTDTNKPVGYVVGFEIVPASHNYPAGMKREEVCTSLQDLDFLPLWQDEEKTKRTPGTWFTYSVEWEESDVEWHTRWDKYLKPTGSRQVHWFSIVNSLFVVGFLATMVAVILTQTLRRDLMKYNQLNAEDEDPEDSGWKFVHGDVFRPPQHNITLSVLVGSGTQVLYMAMIVLSFALLGLLSPSSRGALVTALLMSGVFLSAAAGYHSLKLYKFTKGVHWKRTTVLAATAFPGFCFSIYIVLNIAMAIHHSTAAVPFLYILWLIILYLFISLPLALVGGYMGFRGKAPKMPTPSSMIPRPIPEQPWWTGVVPSVIFTGVWPFASVFIEMFFIFSSLWLNQIYYMFGFLSLVFLILVITSAEITILNIYATLSQENYHWWWRAFLSAGSSGLYLFAYCVVFFTSKMDLSGFVPVLFYFGMSSILSVAFGLMNGAVGFMAGRLFVTRIYTSLKID